MKSRFSKISFLIILFLFSEISADVFLDSYEELKAAYEFLDYTWNDDVVPRVFIEKIPEEIKDLHGVERRRFFVRLVLPLVLLENEKIAAEHDYIVPIAAKSQWSAEDIEIIKNIAEKYNIVEPEDDLASFSEEQKEIVRYYLDHKIRPIPPAIAIGQAALESGWGTSRFTFEGNNLFGHVSPDPSKGIKPKRWSGNQRHIRIFDSVKDSIEAYMLNLNKNRAYKKFRWLRRTHPDDLSKMAEGFNRYAIIKEAYVGRLRTVMFKYGVYKINNTKLDDSGKADVLDKLAQPYIH